MNIIEYLDKNNIKWFPANVQTKVENSLVKKLQEPLITSYGSISYVPKNTDFDECIDFKIRQTIVDHFDYIVIDTSVVNQIDIDDPAFNQEDLKKFPYFDSMLKKLPHYFVYIDHKKLSDNKLSYWYGNKAFTNKVINIEGGDILCGLWSYCRKDAIVYNASNDIPTLEHVSRYISLKIDSSYDIKNIGPIKYTSVGNSTMCVSQIIPMYHDKVHTFTVKDVLWFRSSFYQIYST